MKRFFLTIKTAICAGTVAWEIYIIVVERNAANAPISNGLILIFAFVALLSVAAVESVVTGVIRAHARKKLR
jgi:hypothetical protein